ncbi:MAG TPA: TetR family transcriptional regulator C-terminal domain-containing protein, partial [Ilumatobacter sp.]|nr:TetR family transcriptional regulator C-terminal domain-containing protein [Ilumatobacter sp.]
LERINLERFQIVEHEQSGFDAVRAAMRAILHGEHSESQLWIAFMARAASDPSQAGIMRNAIEVWVARWAELVERGQRDGSIRAELDPDSVGVELHALVNGLRMRAQFRPSRGSRRWPLAEDDLALLDGLRPGNA